MFIRQNHDILQDKFMTIGLNRRIRLLVQKKLEKHDKIGL